MPADSLPQDIPTYTPAERSDIRGNALASCGDAGSWAEIQRPSRLAVPHNSVQVDGSSIHAGVQQFTNDNRLCETLPGIRALHSNLPGADDILLQNFGENDSGDYTGHGRHWAPCRTGSGIPNLNTSGLEYRPSSGGPSSASPSTRLSGGLFDCMKPHPMQDGFTRPLCKTARHGEIREQSWLRSGRHAAPNEATQAQFTQESGSKGTKRSDYGLVRSDLNNMTIKDAGVTFPPPSLPGSTRPIKRPAEKPQTRLSDNARPSKGGRSQNEEREIFQLPSSLRPSPTRLNDFHRAESEMLLQPDTRPITQEQLVGEVKGIYAGLVMVEKKCVEIDLPQAQTTNKLSNEQWQALIALHRKLLHEHHDFFLASQHPSSSAPLRRLATKYAMPARMWRHGIHSFLELLRHTLPDSLNHMLAFIYLAHSMMALLVESVPSFQEPWIECLGDLARYRMAVEENNLRQLDSWSEVTRLWHDNAPGRSPDVGRIRHHLAVLARPDIVQQLFYYPKALASAIPFQNSQESLVTLFGPVLDFKEKLRKYPIVESAHFKSHGIFFTRGAIHEYRALCGQLVYALNIHVERVTALFRTQRHEIGSSLFSAIFDFGELEAFLIQGFREHAKNQRLNNGHATLDRLIMAPDQQETKLATMRRYRSSMEGGHSDRARTLVPTSQDSSARLAIFTCNALADVVALLEKNFAVGSQCIWDNNIVPYMHVVLAHLSSLASVPDVLPHVENRVPWASLTALLNTLVRSSVVDPHVANSPTRTVRQLPEDFTMRGLLIWAKHYFTDSFFRQDVLDEDERKLELPSHAAPRAERCLWVGVGLASAGHLFQLCSSRLTQCQLYRGFGHDTLSMNIRLKPCLTGAYVREKTMRSMLGSSTFTCIRLSLTRMSRVLPMGFT